MIAHHENLIFLKAIISYTFSDYRDPELLRKSLDARHNYLYTIAVIHLTTGSMYGPIIISAERTDMRVETRGKTNQKDDDLPTMNYHQLSHGIKPIGIWKNWVSLCTNVSKCFTPTRNPKGRTEIMVLKQDE